MYKIKGGEKEDVAITENIGKTHRERCKLYRTYVLCIASILIWLK